GVVLEDVVQERRAAWPPYGRTVAHDVLLLDANGLVRARTPLRTLDDRPGTSFVMLVALPPDIVAVDVRPSRRPWFLQHEDMAARRDRPDGNGSVEHESFDTDRLSWSYEHSSGARATQYVDLSVGGVWSPWIALPRCADDVVLPLSRVVADD